MVREIDIESLYIHWKNNKRKQMEGVIARDIGEILLKKDTQNISRAEDWIQKAIEADEKKGIRFELGINFASYSELFKQKGDRQKARECLGKAIEILKECGADGWVNKYQKELALLS
jgi:tetratricopeptide (TPR) repeat protein